MMRNSYFNEILKKLAKDDKTNMTDVISDRMIVANGRAVDLYENNIQNIRWLKDGKVKSLHLPSIICRELSRVICSEFALNIQGDNERAVYLDGIGKTIEKELPIWCERATAFGNMVLKPFVYANDVYVKAYRIGDYIPIRYREDGILDSAVFISSICKKGQWYMRLEYHHIDNGTYTIENSAYYAQNEKGLIGGAADMQSIEEWANIEPIVQIEGLREPLYGVYKNPFSNSVDIDSHLGISLYASCYDLFKECDELWESIWFEMKSGERKMFAPSGAYKRMGGEKHSMSRFYKELSTDNEIFHDFSPVFRNGAYSERLQEIFKRIEENCGLSYGIISDPATVDRTATEVKHSKERMQATVTSVQNALQFTIEDTIKAADAVCDLYGITSSGTYETVFNWDDSVIESRQEKSDRALTEYQNGLIDQAEYFVQTRGMSREEAETYIQSMQLQGQERGQDWFSDKEGT